MSEEPKDDVAAMSGRRRQIIERIAGELKKINDGNVVENDLYLSTRVEELAQLGFILVVQRDIANPVT